MPYTSFHPTNKLPTFPEGALTLEPCSDPGLSRSSKMALQCSHSIAVNEDVQRYMQDGDANEDW